jgi:hypothetical protein
MRESSREALTPGPIPLPRRLATTASWPAGMVLTTWSYVWRTTPIHRRNVGGSLPDDLPPPLPPGISVDGVQEPDHGAGPLLHRVYLGRIREPHLNATGLMARVQADPNVVAPSALARFVKTVGEDGHMGVEDEFVVRMPGPWDGPVRTLEVTPRSFRFATLDGHLEAGQIEWRAQDRNGLLEFQVESWARAGDRLSALLHGKLRMAKEVQLHMWSSVVERVARVSGGNLVAGVEIVTRHVPPEAFDH